MKRQVAKRRGWVNAVISLAIAGLSHASIGCDPAGVGSSPSVKKQMQAFYASGGQAPLAAKPVGKGARAAGPKSIKHRVFIAAPQSPEN
jgi:hypothetical protein